VRATFELAANGVNALLRCDFAQVIRRRFVDSDHERATRAHAWDRLFHHLALQRGCAAGEHGVAAQDSIELRVGNDLPH